MIRTLALKPDLVLLDEPFSALDPQTRLNVSYDVYNILKKEKKTALMVTHDLSEALLFSNKILVMSNRPGKIIKEMNIDFSSLSPHDKRKENKYSDYYEELWRYFSENKNNYN